MTYLKKNDKIWYMKENTNIILTFLPDGISRITLNDPSNYNALSSKNIKSLIDILLYKDSLEESESSSILEKTVIKNINPTPIIRRYKCLLG